MKQIKTLGTSLVVQWLRIHLPTQGALVQSLVHEDSTCPWETEPMCDDDSVCALEPPSHNYWAPWATTPEVLDPRACSLQQEKPRQWEPHALQIETSPPLTATRERPSTAKNKINKYIKESTVISTTKQKCTKILAVLLLGPILSQFSWKNLEFHTLKNHTCCFYLPDLIVYTVSLANPTPFILDFCCFLNLAKQIPT